MEDLVILLCLCAIVIAVFAALGSWIATQKRREPFEGLLLGAIFGPLGCLIEAMLPSGDRRARNLPSRSAFWDNPPEPTWLNELEGRSDGTRDWLRDLERKSKR